MAKPRVFISSTFYDLRLARAELEHFIRDMGYEPVLNERGQIPYGKDMPLEEYCYKEISKVHILISIIGGRFGSQSRDSDKYSISNMEIKEALKQGKQVYIFIESGVLSEYSTYKNNKNIENIKYSHVDDVKVYKFIEELYALPNNNQISSFDNMHILTAYLREQWAGLFERYLDGDAQGILVDMMRKMEQVTSTLEGLTEVYRKSPPGNDSEEKEKIMDEIIIQNHPIFSAMRKMLRVRYRIFFTNQLEMEDWLKSARSGKSVDIEWDDLNDIGLRYKIMMGKDSEYTLDVSSDLFDSNKSLKPMLPSEWQESMLRLTLIPKSIDLDEEIPF